jgi:hypothetical protein
MKYTQSIMARLKLASNKQLLNLHRLISREVQARGLET